MAINVSAANTQAAQLNDNIAKLRDAKRQMQAYRSSISNNWQGKEVTYILTAIDRVIGDIDSAIRNLDSLSDDIKSTATQIKREEDAAAAAARAKAEKQQRIRQAQTAYDTACVERDNLRAQLEALEKKLEKASARNRKNMMRELEMLQERLQEAQKRVNTTYTALRAAKG